jgi:predicted GNAT family acetyltransferase
LRLVHGTHAHFALGAPAMNNYEIINNPQKHRFEADLGDGSLAIADYDLTSGKIIFTHTEVPAEHEGHGIGTALVRFALNFARENRLLVIPVCPFFAAYFKKHPEEQNLLDADSRASLGLEEND